MIRISSVAIYDNRTKIAVISLSLSSIHLFVPILRKPFTGQSGLFQATADNIEQLIRNGLLTALVILFRQILNQLIGIVCRRLHGKHTGSMFRSIGIEKHGKYLLTQHFWQKFRYQLADRKVPQCNHY